MHLIQLFLPLYDNDRQLFNVAFFDIIKAELTEKFGGITAYTRVPATGLWKETDQKIIHDEIVLFEIMIQEIDLIYWNSFKVKLQNIFHQKEIIIRASPIQLL